MNKLKNKKSVEDARAGVTLESIIGRIKAIVESGLNKHRGGTPYPTIFAFKGTTLLDNSEIDFFNVPVIANESFIQLDFRLKKVTHFAYITPASVDQNEFANPENCLCIHVITPKAELKKYYRFKHSIHYQGLEEITAENLKAHIELRRCLLPSPRTLQNALDYDSIIDDYSSLIKNYVVKFGDLRQPFIFAVSQSGGSFLAKIPTESKIEFTQKAHTLVTKLRADYYLQGFTAWRTPVTEASNKYEVLSISLFTRKKSIYKAYRIFREGDGITLRDENLAMASIHGIFSNMYSPKYLEAHHSPHTGTRTSN